MNPVTFQQRLRRIGIPGVNGRTGAIRQLLLQDPAPVVARMLGYHEVHAELIASQAGAHWKNYAPGDHTQSRPTRTPTEHATVDHASLPVPTPDVDLAMAV